MDAKGKQALVMVVSRLDLFCVAVSWVSNHAHVVGCARQTVNIVQAFWQKALVFNSADREIQQ